MRYFSQTSLIIAIFTILYTALPVRAQFPISIPKTPKTEKPKNPDTAQPATTDKTAPTAGGQIYFDEKGTNTPRVIQPRVFISAATSKSYWKMPNVSNTTSWLPVVNAWFSYNLQNPIKAVAEWFNPDGSLWFTEDLRYGWSGSTMSLKSDKTWELMDTKSTNTVGNFSLKIKNKETGAEIYSAKFRVSKFLASFNAADKNKVDFAIDHDWLLPLAMVDFGDYTQSVDKGGRVNFSTWLKGDIRHDELEAQLLYNGSVVAARKASSGMANDERMAMAAPVFAKDSIVRRWAVWFDHVYLDNGYGTLPGAHSIDRNPGQYVFKLTRNGTPIREFAFTVGSDGRVVRPAYANGFLYPQNGVIFPAKVLGNHEKWNMATARTDMFFGNPLAGFPAQ